MQRPGWAVVIVAALLSALVTGVATTMVLSVDGPIAVPGSDAVDETADERVAAMKERVARLERDNADLRARRERPRVVAPPRGQPDGEGQSTPEQNAEWWSRNADQQQTGVPRTSGGFFISQAEFVAPQAKLLELLSGNSELRADLAEALEQGGDVAAAKLLEIVRDPEMSLAVRGCAVETVAAVAPAATFTVVDAVLRSPDAEAGVRAKALWSATAAAISGHGVPDSVRALAFDDSADAAERDTARSVMVHGAPDDMLPYVDQWAASTDPSDRQRAHSLTRGVRHKSYLPLLTRMVNDERYRGAANDLIGTIAQLKDRSWSPVQMTGEPDTPIGGDLGTAWASKSPQMGRVWIELTYAQAVTPSQIRIRETLAPGAVARIAVRDGTEWRTLWEGEAGAEAAPRWFAPRIESVDFTTHTVRLELDTDRADGWNEIDAVELIGVGGLRQWAQSARASTSYADSK